MRLKRAYAFGWKKTDLSDEGDGIYCECPECYDDAGPCIFCYGDGFVDPFIESQQRARILIMAKYNERVPVCFTRDHIGRLSVAEDIILLSSAHSAQLADEGLIFHLRSFFGDSLSLNDAGKQAALEAEFLYRDLCRQFIRDKEKLKLERELYKQIEHKPRYVEHTF